MTKKVLLIASFAPSLVKFRLQLIKDLMASGYQVITCAPADPLTEKKLLEINVEFIPIGLNRTGMNPLHDLLTIRQMVSLIKTNKPDVILTYTIKPVIYGSLAAKIAGTCNVYSMITGRSYGLTKKGLLRFFLKKILKFALKSNKKIFFQNSDDIQFFCDSSFVKQSQIALINGSGVDITEFVPTSYPSVITFLLIGRLLINKGIRDYVAAAEIIKKQYPDVRFLLVGPTENHPNAITPQELQSWIARDTVEYLGEISDVRDVITQSSVFVLPSYHEGLSRAVLESMAMGRPIISTDAPGCREPIEENRNGFLVPKQNVAELAKIMHRFIKEPELISTMGKISRDLAVEKYSVHKVNKVMLREMEIIT